MKSIKMISVLLISLLTFYTALYCLPQQKSDNLRWYKGNTHTHTLNSDGDSSPDDVVRWSREHGYNFLVITDHNYLTTIDGLNAVYGAKEQFLVIKGVEVSDRFGLKSITQTSNGRSQQTISSKSKIVLCLSFSADTLVSITTAEVEGRVWKRFGTMCLQAASFFMELLSMMPTRLKNRGIQMLPGQDRVGEQGRLEHRYQRKWDS